MKWVVKNRDTFKTWFDTQDDDIKIEVLALLTVLEAVGPNLGRPYSDTLNGSKHPNMKELRLKVDRHPIRICFAFDPERKAIILCAGDKKGKNEKLFYKELIKLADQEFDDHLKEIKE
ncbi:type II toxin-antitoxin system RelE/ParE family toxin [Rosenbergiella metrosideri]|uniref:type II toxin-antitoxin system RelE/ParE family toxin n=1 Tax=Rosenbergiella metrosideri TaxID=2921185 RepID=UPI001F4FE1F7|nr:type II toxin-antitoxin system RelE/ParE family toxin [Rosenbergiella metrosideri]